MRNEGDFEKYSRFHRTDGRFREAMAHLRAGRLAEAEAALQQVVDPEEREPAFRRAGLWNESSQL